MKKIVLIVLSVLLSSCAHEMTWVNPNKNESTFYAEKFQCIKQSTSNTCKIVSGGNSQTCTKNALTGGIDCYGSSSPGGTVCNDEVNQQFFSACMQDKGWRFVDKKQYVENQLNKVQQPQISANTNNNIYIGNTLNNEQAQAKCLSNGLIKDTYGFNVCIKTFTKQGN